MVLYDTEIALSNRWVFPLASAVCTPQAFAAQVRRHHHTYDGYQELAYLHPDRFVPEKGKLKLYNLTKPLSIVGFVSWDASHDLGDAGIGHQTKIEVVNSLPAD